MTSITNPKRNTRWIAAGALLSLAFVTACPATPLPGTANPPAAVGSPAAGPTGPVGDPGAPGQTGSTTPATPADAPVAPIAAAAALTVASTDKLVINFTRPMDPATINPTTFTLSAGSIVIPGTVTYSGSTATFVPKSALATSTTYTATLTTKAKDLAGIGLAANHVWEFTTTAGIQTQPAGSSGGGAGGGGTPAPVVITAPTVVSVTPIDLASPTVRNQTVRATFSTPMNQATLATSFTLTAGANPPVPVTMTYSGNTVSFTPIASLTPNTLYTAKISTGAKNVAGTGVAANYIWTYTTGANDAQLPVTMGANLANYAVLGGSTVTTVPPTVINGSLGVFPLTSITGGPTVNLGTIEAATVNAGLAQGELTTAYNDAAGRTAVSPVLFLTANIGGMTLAPNLYRSATPVEISSGDLTFDGQGDPNAVFIIQCAQTFSMTPGRQMFLIRGAKAANIFWQVGSSAVFDTTSVIKGNIMADQSITLRGGATLDGRALARIAAVNLDNNTVTKPTP